MVAIMANVSRATAWLVHRDRPKEVCMDWAVAQKDMEETPRYRIQLRIFCKGLLP
jgi:hypothetical protein